MDNPIGRFVTLSKDDYQCGLYGHNPGTYEVFVGEYGWDDGDLYIRTNKGKLKLKDFGEKASG